MTRRRARRRPVGAPRAQYYKTIPVATPNATNGIKRLDIVAAGGIDGRPNETRTWTEAGGDPDSGRLERL